MWRQWEKVGSSLKRGLAQRKPWERRVATLGTQGWDPRKLRTQKPFHSVKSHSKDARAPERPGDAYKDPGGSRRHKDRLRPPPTNTLTHTRAHTQSQTLRDGWTHLGRQTPRPHPPRSPPDTEGDHGIHTQWVTRPTTDSGIHTTKSVVTH